MNIEIANRLVQLRKKHGYSQEELAEKLGLSRQAVSKWERAEASPDTDNLILLARLYGVSLDQLLYTEDEISRPEEPDPESADTEKGAKDNPESDTSNKKVSIGLHGIHVVDGDEEVHVSLKGIHVREAEEEVHVGWDGVHAHEKDGDWVDIGDGRVVVNGKEYGSEEFRKSIWHELPFSLLVVIAYILLGVWTGAWHPGWLLFLTIPLYHTTISAVLHRDPNRFAYPVLALLGFFLLGFLADAWMWSWLLFLTIPLYYTLIAAVKKRNPNIFAYPVLALLFFFLFGFFADAWHPGWVVLLTVPLYYGIVDLFRRV